VKYYFKFFLYIFTAQNFVMSISIAPTTFTLINLKF